MNMDIMREFKMERLIVITDNADEANMFLDECMKEGLTWSSGHRLGDRVYRQRFSLDERTGFAYDRRGLSGIKCGLERYYEHYSDYMYMQKIDYCDFSKTGRYMIELPA